MAEFHKRVSAWTSLRLGMHFNSIVYRTFCYAVFGFLWQLEDPPPSVLELEKWALRRMAPGPGNWVRPVDLNHLSSYGHPFEFYSFCHTSLAAKMRVLKYEPQLNFHRLHSDLVHHLANASMKRDSWADWYESSYLLTLAKARAQVEKLGVTD